MDRQRARLSKHSLDHRADMWLRDSTGRGTLTPKQGSTVAHSPEGQGRRVWKAYAPMLIRVTCYGKMFQFLFPFSFLFFFSYLYLLLFRFFFFNLG